MDDLVNNIKKAIVKFDLNLQGKTILTEAATGNYVVTSIIAAVSGAKQVYAFAKESKHGSVSEIKKQTSVLADYFSVKDKINIITSLEHINLKDIDILTNTGFLRPIDKNIIEKLDAKCVIPLMWETWEFREDDLDLEACLSQKIKVYGTNEDDKRLKTKEYIGFMVLRFLLTLHHTPFSSKVLILGCSYFTDYVEAILKQNQYIYKVVTSYECKIALEDFDVIVLLEHHKKNLLIGEDAFIEVDNISKRVDVIHICGNVNFKKAKFNYIPNKPAKFGYMSYTADFMGSQVVIDLHTAGLKVAEGMLRANKMNFDRREYKAYMEKNYPAMSFEDERCW